MVAYILRSWKVLFLDITTHLSLFSLLVNIVPSFLLIYPSLPSTNDILDINLRNARSYVFVRNVSC